MTWEIPMGLPFAPELARMATAFLLRNNEQPLGHTLTIYFDDATYPILDLPLESYILKETPANHTQDAIYNPERKQFTPYTQAFRKFQEIFDFKTFFKFCNIMMTQ